jgi:acid phosphatase type 7
VLKTYKLQLLFISFITGILFLSDVVAETGVEVNTSDPIALYLTWQQDPTSTMTIDWHVINNEVSDELFYREQNTQDWEVIYAESHPFPYSNRRIYRTELKGLKSGTKYEFRFGDNSPVYLFRTMPETLNRPLRIAIGGDTMHLQEWFEETNRQVLKYDPDFAVVGGDIAYADALPPERQRIRGDAQTRDRAEPRPALEEGDNLWYHWFDAYKNTMITENNRVIPMLVTTGNHEVRGSYYSRVEEYEQTDEFRQQMAPYFFSLFAMPGQPGYNVLDFGDYMSILLLDSAHVNPADGIQSEWLENVLKERNHVPHLFPVYHLPMFPSVRDFDTPEIVEVRNSWLPLFENHGIRLAFENHDHAYKRTHPIRDGQISSNGIVFIGDGSWGTVPREVRSTGSEEDFNEEYWYIKRAESVMHFILLTVDGPHQHMLMVDSEGNVIDEYPETPKLNNN